MATLSGYVDTVSVSAATDWLCWPLLCCAVLCRVILLSSYLQIELARLEMKDKSFPCAIEVLEGALDMAKDKFGDETAEACEYLVW